MKELEWGILEKCGYRLEPFLREGTLKVVGFGKGKNISVLAGKNVFVKGKTGSGILQL